MNRLLNKFQLDIIGFQIGNLNLRPPTTAFDPYLIDINVSTKFKLSLAAKEIRVHQTITITLGEERIKPVIGELQTIATFYCSSIGNLLEGEEEITLKEIVKNVLSGVVYSTSRGILISNQLGTSLQNVIIPIIDPQFLYDQKTNKV